MAFSHSRLLLLALMIVAAALPTRAEPQPRTDAYGDPLPDGAMLRLGTSRFRLGVEVSAAACSPDGRWIAFCARDYRDTSIHLLDLASGKEIKRFGDNGPNREAETLAFSPNSQLLAAASTRDDAEEVEVFDVDFGKRVRVLNKPKRRTSVLRLSADGKVLVCDLGFPGADDAALAWNTSTGKEIARFFLPRDKLKGLVVSRDGKLLAGWGDIGVVVWDLESGKESLRLSPDVVGWVCDVVFSPDEKHFAVAETSAVNAWDTTTGKQVLQTVARRDVFTRLS